MFFFLHFSRYSNNSESLTLQTFKNFMDNEQLVCFHNYLVDNWLFKVNNKATRITCVDAFLVFCLSTLNRYVLTRWITFDSLRYKCVQSQTEKQQNKVWISSKFIIKTPTSVYFGVQNKHQTCQKSKLELCKYHLAMAAHLYQNLIIATLDPRWSGIWECWRIATVHLCGGVVWASKCI